MVGAVKDSSAVRNERAHDGAGSTFLPGPAFRLNDMGLYEFDLENPDTWHNFNAPPLVPSVPTELLKIGGMNHKGQPRLRAVWGGKEQVYIEGDEDVEAGWYLKYHVCFVQRLEGYEYADPITGEKHSVSNLIALPDGVPLNLVHSREEIGKPRWIIEIWRNAGDLNGFFTQDGYYHLLTVQQEPIDQFSGMGPYREIDSDILETLKGMIHFMENTTEAQREAMRAADEGKARAEKQKRDAANWEDFDDNVERIVKDKLYEHAA